MVVLMLAIQVIHPKEGLKSFTNVTCTAILSPFKTKFCSFPILKRQAQYLGSTEGQDIGAESPDGLDGYQMLGLCRGLCICELSLIWHDMNRAAQQCSCPAKKRYQNGKMQSRLSHAIYLSHRKNKRIRKVRNSSTHERFAHVQLVNHQKRNGRFENMLPAHALIHEMTAR